MWERKAKTDGRAYLRFQVKEKFVPYTPPQNTPPRQPQQSQPQAAPEFNDDIPF
jgi:hypothetical protein